ncbi:MAG: hypothetical protein JNK76_08070 [Planctomycetales bacterium]|nr:hypothetical protein [Planctomycetales bacterium]
MRLLQASMLLCVSFFNSLKLAQASEVEESLRFRHPKPATVHFLDRTLAAEYQRRLQSVGCTATLSPHWGHVDLTYQCSDWHVLHCRGHGEAMDWMKFFSLLCFESSHVH